MLAIPVAAEIVDDVEPDATGLRVGDDLAAVGGLRIGSSASAGAATGSGSCVRRSFSPGRRRGRIRRLSGVNTVISATSGAGHIMGQ